MEPGREKCQDLEPKELPSLILGRPWALECCTERRTGVQGRSGALPGCAHLVITAAGGHAVLDIGHEGINEPRVVSHGLAARIGRAQVPAGESREGVRRQGRRGEGGEWLGARREESRWQKGARGDEDEVGGLVGREQGKRHEEEVRKDHSGHSAPSWLGLVGLSSELSSFHPSFRPPGPQACNFYDRPGL